MKPCTGLVEIHLHATSVDGKLILPRMWMPIARMISYHNTVLGDVAIVPATCESLRVLDLSDTSVHGASFAQPALVTSIFVTAYLLSFAAHR